MTYEVRLREEADRDLTEAALWYELHGSGLGYQFLDQALRAVAFIAEHPLAYPTVSRETRSATFPKLAILQTSPGAVMDPISILACAAPTLPAQGRRTIGNRRKGQGRCPSS